MRILATVSFTVPALVVLALCVLYMMQHARIRDLESRLSEVEETHVVRAEIVVTESDDTLGRPGEYFRFDHSPLDAAFGRDAWVGRRFAVILPRSGAFDQVRLWLRSGETEIGFGRSEADPESHRWRVGEVLMVVGVQDTRERP